MGVKPKTKNIKIKSFGAGAYLEGCEAIFATKNNKKVVTKWDEKVYSYVG